MKYFYINQDIKLTFFHLEIIIWIAVYPPREKGHKLQIFKIDFFSWFDSRILPVSLTERIF